MEQHSSVAGEWRSLRQPCINGGVDPSVVGRLANRNPLHLRTLSCCPLVLSPSPSLRSVMKAFATGVHHGGPWRFRLAGGLPVSYFNHRLGNILSAYSLRLFLASSPQVDRQYWGILFECVCLVSRGTTRTHQSAVMQFFCWQIAQQSNHSFRRCYRSSVL